MSLPGSAGVPPASLVKLVGSAGETPALPGRQLVLSSGSRERLLTEARAAFPSECCGLLEGIRSGSEIKVLRLHPTRNLAAESDRFEIDPAEHIRLLKSLRGTGREIVGCYHSHPNGRPEPSARDRAFANEDGSVWLIAGVTADSAGEIAAYVVEENAFRPLA